MLTQSERTTTYQNTSPKCLFVLLITHADDSRGSKAFSDICLSVRTIIGPTQKTNDPKVFKLSIGISSMWYI